MMNYIYSAETNKFYPLVLQDAYEKNGEWPSNYIEVDDDIFNEFTSCNEGKIRVAGSDGLPSWADIPSQPNSVLLSSAIATLAAQYKSDIADLNISYLAAIVNDGHNEFSKQQYVRDQISARKIKYNADIADARAKYQI